MGGGGAARHEAEGGRRGTKERKGKRDAIEIE